MHKHNNYDVTGIVSSKMAGSPVLIKLMNLKKCIIQHGLSLRLICSFPLAVQSDNRTYFKIFWMHLARCVCLGLVLISHCVNLLC